MLERNLKGCVTKSSPKQSKTSEKAVSLSNELSVRLFSQSDVDYQEYLCDMMVFGISFWRVDEGMYIRIPPMDIYISGGTYTYREEGQEKQAAVSKLSREKLIAMEKP